MKYIYFLIIFFTFFISLKSQDTVFVNSKADVRIQLSKDSMYSYETGKSICYNLAKLFQDLTNTNDYDSYFLDAWSGNIKFNQPVDTLLTYSEFLPNYEFPDSVEKYQLNSKEQIGKRIFLQFILYDSIKTIPYAKVVGSEMPTIYIYQKPKHVFIYKKSDVFFETKNEYSIIDIVTRFICDKNIYTKTPFNIIRYYKNNKLYKINWVDPIDNSKIIKTFKL